jgi:predicted 3-demethylubiquinone-9 3-methyltransferase (glyoxalase superfamily)
MKKITPFLWFDNQAEEAMNFYTSIFKDSKIGTVSRYGDAGPLPKGTIMVGTFQINGQEFMVLNGGPLFKFTEAISFYLPCESKEEVDEYWDKLSAGGQTSQCGWLKDKFGLSWQVVPTLLGELMSSKDPKKANNVMAALMKMTKLDSKLLQEAYDKE